MAAASKARKVLTLKEKVEVIDYVSKNPGSGSRKVWQDADSVDPEKQGRHQGRVREEWPRG